MELFDLEFFFSDAYAILNFQSFDLTPMSQGGRSNRVSAGRRSTIVETIPTSSSLNVVDGNKIRFPRIQFSLFFLLTDPCSLSTIYRAPINDTSSRFRLQ